MDAHGGRFDVRLTEARDLRKRVLTGRQGNADHRLRRSSRGRVAGTFPGVGSFTIYLERELYIETNEAVRAPWLLWRSA